MRIFVPLPIVLSVLYLWDDKRIDHRRG
jgi:hypothetical protein